MTPSCHWYYYSNAGTKKARVNLRHHHMRRPHPSHARLRESPPCNLHLVAWNFPQDNHLLMSSHGVMQVFSW